MPRTATLEGITPFTEEITLFTEGIILFTDFHAARRTARASHTLQVVNPSASAAADLQLADCRSAGRGRFEREGNCLVCLGRELAAFVGGGERGVVARDGEGGGLGVNVLEVDGRAPGSLLQG